MAEIGRQNLPVFPCSLETKRDGFRQNRLRPLWPSRRDKCVEDRLSETREPDRDMTVKGYHTAAKGNLEIVGLCVLLLSVVASFLVGWLLGEDSTGGMRGDFYCAHWLLIERFSTTSWATAVVDYNAAMNPLLYMIASLLPLHDDQQIYHGITFVVGLLIWALLSWAYYRRYSKYGIDWLWASFGASAILLSPTFRSSTFWGNTDWLPFAFCAGTSLLLSRFQDSETYEARAIGPFSLITLAVVSSCAFYTRQYYAFLPIFAAWIVLTRTKTSPFLVVGIFFLATLPEMYLVYVWKGFNPPTAQFMLHPTMVNLWKLGAGIGLLSLPIVVGCIRRSLSDVLPEWWGARSTAVALVGLLVFIIVIMALGPPEWLEKGFGGGGGGIIVKAGVRMGALGSPFILTVSYLGLVAASLFATRSATNAVLAATYLAPLFVAAPTYQRYLEPSLVVALLLFADTRTARIVFTKRVLMCNFVFAALILPIGIVYYDFFHHGADVYDSSKCLDPAFPGGPHFSPSRIP